MSVNQKASRYPQSKKDRILKVALELFSKNGFDATSVDSIAERAEVNKALIYYYFRSKDDIILSLFISTIDELSKHLQEAPEEDSNFRNKIKKEIEFFKDKKEIISLLLMESLKDKQNYFLFECGEMITQNELERHGKNINKIHDTEHQKQLIFEFFTGIIPIISFIAYEDKWCQYFQCNPEETVNRFLDAMEQSHFKTTHS
jgi:AcrR family transcriptional regulator